MDLKDAYLLIPMHENSKKFLRFFYKNKLFQFNALPFGLSTAPFIFTKVLKPVIEFFREKGIVLVVYLDDFLIFGKLKLECAKNVKIVSSLLQKLGLIINWKKSSLEPKNVCKFLGFIIDSINMTLEMQVEKREKISHGLRIM